MLLERLYEAGVNGRMWRLLDSWYEGASCRVKLDGEVSGSFHVERGVKQGSVLSPALFLLVMDPLLRQLQASGVGLSVNGFYAGGFLHADDVRTLAPTEDSLRQQVAAVKTFADENFLTLNLSKCEIVTFSKDQSRTHPVCEIDGAVIPAGDCGKCLGYWWRGDLLATKSVDENIAKARRAFFHYGSIGVFQGELSPLSSRSVIETCVMPVLLFGSENWILTDQLMERLEGFQGELAKRVLRWPQHHSNTAAITTLDVRSMKSRMLVLKLDFLRRLLGSDLSKLGGRAIEAFSDDIESLCLVKECRELEEVFGLHLTDSLLERCPLTRREVREEILKRDRRMVLLKCQEKAPVIAEVAERVGWARLWDNVLGYGGKAVRGLQHLSRAMSHHGRGSHPCCLCDAAYLDCPVLDHILDRHGVDLALDSDLDRNKLLDCLEGLEHLEFLNGFSRLYSYHLYHQQGC